MADQVTPWLGRCETVDRMNEAPAKHGGTADINAKQALGFSTIAAFPIPTAMWGSHVDGPVRNLVGWLTRRRKPGLAHHGAGP